jgi:hypothetical protein
VVALRVVVIALLGLLLLLVWFLSPYALGALFGGDGVELQRRADIGESFGAVAALFSALALFGLILTAYLQRSELAAQRRQLELQRAELTETRHELHRIAEAGLRAAHIDLLKMSISNPELAAVWPSDPEDGPERSRQLDYANLIVTHQEMAYELRILSDEELAAVFGYLFTSPVLRDFWSGARMIRRQVAGTSNDAARFHQIVDEAYLDSMQ